MAYDEKEQQSLFPLTRTLMLETRF